MFFKRTRNKQSPINEKQIESRKYHISVCDEQYADLFECTTTLKVWLPETVENQLSELSCFLDVSVSDFIRQIIFVHLYGRYAFLGCIEREVHIFDERAFMPKVCYSMPSYPGREKQKAPDKMVCATKIYLPKRMKDDLLIQAAKKYQPVSEYCRQIIILHLHGLQTTYPDPPEGLDEGFE